MNEEVKNDHVDTLKLVSSVSLIIIAMVMFYYFAEHSTLFRVLGLLATVLISFAIFLQTDKGRVFWQFAQDTRMEVRKVVWPTRQETVQTTMIVLAMVLLVAVFLWLLDMMLLWAVRVFTGQGG